MIYTDKNKKLIYADLTYRVRGAIFNVYNELGFGHKEQVYHKALSIELEKMKLKYKSQESVNVIYKDIVVRNYRPDIIVDEKLIIELKAVDFMPKSFETQIINYLKSTNFPLGLLVNFGTQKLYIKRLVWTGNQRKSETNQRVSLS